MLEERISRMKEQQLKINAGHDKLNDIEKIYGVKFADGLGEAVLSTYTQINTEYNEKLKGTR